MNLMTINYFLWIKLLSLVYRLQSVMISNMNALISLSECNFRCKQQLHFIQPLIIKPSSCHAPLRWRRMILQNGGFPRRCKEILWKESVDNSFQIIFFSSASSAHQQVKHLFPQWMPNDMKLKLTLTHLKWKNLRCSFVVSWSDHLSSPASCWLA